MLAFKPDGKLVTVITLYSFDIVALSFGITGMTDTCILYCQGFCITQSYIKRRLTGIDHSTTRLGVRLYFSPVHAKESIVSVNATPSSDQEMKML